MLGLVFLPIVSQAQESRISGRVVDAETNEPIPFASLRLHKTNMLAVSDEKGYFQLGNILNNEHDTLRVSSAGYGFENYCIDRGKVENISIKLGRSTKGAHVRQGPCGYVFTATSRQKEESIIVGLPGTEYAFYFKNEKVKTGTKMRTVTLYIGSNGFPRDYFRLFIYKADGANHGPSTSMVRGQMAVFNHQLLETGNWCTLDLRGLDITVPEEGYYVSVEFPLGSGGPNLTSLIANYAPTSFIMRPALESNECIVWSQVLGKWSGGRGKNNHYIPGVWSLLSAECGSFRRYSGMLKVEVEPTP